MEVSVSASEVVGVVLAAGRGSRLGRGPKAFVCLDGETLLARAVGRLRAAGVRDVVVVLPEGPDPVLIPVGVRVVRNLAPATGPLGSACLGVGIVPDDAPGVVLYPVDHHAVTVDDLLRVLVGAADVSPACARVVPRFEGRGGHPVLLLPAGLEAIRAVTNPSTTTLRDVLSPAGDIQYVDGVSSGVRRNLNTPQDMPLERQSLATETQ